MTEHLVIYWLLYFLSSSMNEPIGIYTSKTNCIKDGKLLTAGIYRKYDCRPVNEIVLKFLAGECLGDDSVKSLLITCNPPSEFNYNRISIDAKALVEAIEQSNEPGDN